MGNEVIQTKKHEHSFEGTHLCGKNDCPENRDLTIGRGFYCTFHANEWKLHF